MAKAVKVERLRPSDLAINSPKVRPVDTFAAPVATDTRAYTNNGLADFISQITPQLQNLNQKRERAILTRQEQQLADMQYTAKDGTYKTLEQVKASGEFVPYNPTVAFAYNKGLGAEIGKNISLKLRSQYEEGLKNGSIQRMDDAGFATWLRESTTKLAEENKQFTLEKGVMAGIKLATENIEAGLTNDYFNERTKYATKMADDSFKSLVKAKLHGVDLTRPEQVGSAIQSLSDHLYSADSAYTGTEVNTKITEAMVEMISVSRNKEELTAISVAARNLKAGSGNLSGTKTWSGLGVDTVIDTAIKRVNELDYEEYTKGVRDQNTQTTALRAEVITHINNGGTFDNFKTKGQYSEFDEASISSTFKTVQNQLKFDEPMDRELYVKAYDYFSGKTPFEAQEALQGMMNGQNNDLGVLSLTQLSSIASMANSIPGRGTQLYGKEYTNIRKELAEGYKIWDVLGKDVKNFTAPEAKKFWQEAEDVLSGLWADINQDPTLLRDILNPADYDRLVTASGGAGVRMQAVFADPQLLRVVNRGLVTKVVEKAPPSELSRITGSAETTDNEDGTQTLTFPNNGSDVTVRVTPRKDN